jgi:hypothetical protein
MLVSGSMREAADSQSVSRNLENIWKLAHFAALPGT